MGALGQVALVALVLAACSDGAGRPDAMNDGGGSDGGPSDSGAERDAGGGDAGELESIAAPRPLGPATTARVTTRRPTFRFEPAPGGRWIDVRVCGDRDCAETLVEATIDGAARDYQPPAPLPAGVAFWSIRARTVRGVSEWTLPWYVRVPPRDGQVATDFGGWIDVNGDGLADLVRTEPGTPASVHVHFGRRDVLLAIEPDQTIGFAGPFVQAWAAGDVDGDGRSDVAIWKAAPPPGTVEVYLGSAAGLTGPIVELASSDPDEYDYGEVVRAVNDATGDGLGDFMLTAGREGEPFLDRVYLFAGDPAGPATPAVWSAEAILALDSGGQDNPSSSSGDANGDGAAEVLWWTTRAIVVLSATADRAEMTSLPLAVDGDAWELSELIDFGDFDGDGRSDAAFGIFERPTLNGTVYVIPGADDGLVVERAIPLPFTVPGVGFGRALHAADLDGDGFDDLVVGADLRAEELPWVFMGSETGLGAMPVDRVDAVVDDVNLGWPGWGHADFDGDGHADLVHVCLGALDPIATVEVFSGRDLTTPVVSWRTLRGATIAVGY